MTDLNNNAFAVFDEEDNSQIINKSNLQDKVTEISKQQSDSSNVNNSDDASWTYPRPRRLAPQFTLKSADLGTDSKSKTPSLPMAPVPIHNLSISPSTTAVPPTAGMSHSIVKKKGSMIHKYYLLISA